MFISFSVTRLAKFHLFGKSLKVLGIFCVLDRIWPTFRLLWQFFDLANGQILKKLPSNLVTLISFELRNTQNLTFYCSIGGMFLADSITN